MGNLLVVLRLYLQTHPLGKVYVAPFDVVLSEHDVFQPDLTFVSTARASVLTDAGAEGAPDLVIEILSPSTSRLDRVNKLKVYAQKGVVELWMVDPEGRRVEVFRLQENPRAAAAIHPEDGTIETVLLPGLQIPCREVFAS